MGSQLRRVTRDEIAELDRVMIEEFGIDLLMMMENAGRALASVAKKMLGGRVLNRNITVLVGKGNNGGGGLVAARHLHNWGASVKVVIASPRSELHAAPIKQLQILEKSGIAVIDQVVELSEADLIIDSLLGYNSKGKPREPYASLISAANRSGRPILALDLPSGLDPDTGKPNEPCIVATSTVALALPKNGAITADGRPFVGMLYLADISVPRALYERFGVKEPVFKDDFIIIIDNSTKQH
ncbi:MAG: NAD(P)H-hydrate epimerase [Candidatus Bathyarchaeia archaeon]